MPTWIDDEGRLRERADDKHQFLRNIPLEFLDPWSSYDSWDAELAIKLITIGYNLDIKGYWDEAKDFPYGSTGWDSAHAYVDVYQRGMSIAKSSIAAGLLKDPDTPANWLAWAKRKGYDVEHLEHPQIALPADAATPAPVVSVSASGGTVPVWTPARKEAARAMQGQLRSKGIKAFAANTAAAFGVTPTRLREVLGGKPKKAPAKKVKGVWDV